MGTVNIDFDLCWDHVSAELSEANQDEKKGMDKPANWHSFGESDTMCVCP